jgi:hypothetical protein
MQNRAKSRFRRWLGDAALPSFVAQQVVATAGAMVMAVLAMVIPAALMTSVGHHTSPGSFGDNMIDQPFFRWADKSNALFPISGLVLGFFSRRILRSRWGVWVWVLPLIVLAWNLLTWEGAGPPTTKVYWAHVWANYFSSACAGSECLYELFVTVPFYTSAAYSLGWLAASLRQNRNIGGSAPSSGT